MGLEETFPEGVDEDGDITFLSAGYGDSEAMLFANTFGVSVHGMLVQRETTEDEWNEELIFGLEFSGNCDAEECHHDHAISIVMPLAQGRKFAEHVVKRIAYFDEHPEPDA